MTSKKISSFKRFIKKHSVTLACVALFTFFSFITIIQQIRGEKTLSFLQPSLIILASFYPAFSDNYLLWIGFGLFAFLVSGHALHYLLKKRPLKIPETLVLISCCTAIALFRFYDLTQIHQVLDFEVISHYLATTNFVLFTKVAFGIANYSKISQGYLLYFLYYLFVSLGGINTFTLKIPIVLSAFVVYILIYKISKEFTKSAPLAGLSMLLFAFGPFEHDWARSTYNFELSLVIPLAILYLFILFENSKEKKYLYGILLLAPLSILSYTATALVALVTVPIAVFFIQKGKPLKTIPIGTTLGALSLLAWWFLPTILSSTALLTPTYIDPIELHFRSGTSPVVIYIDNNNDMETAKPALIKQFSKNFADLITLPTQTSTYTEYGKSYIYNYFLLIIFIGGLGGLIFFFRYRYATGIVILALLLNSFIVCIISSGFGFRKFYLGYSMLFIAFIFCIYGLLNISKKQKILCVSITSSLAFFVCFTVVNSALVFAAQYSNQDYATNFNEMASKIINKEYLTTYNVTIDPKTDLADPGIVGYFLYNTLKKSPGELLEPNSVTNRSYLYFITDLKSHTFNKELPVVIIKNEPDPSKELVDEFEICNNECKKFYTYNGN
ncbi:MAG: glycosyltransferase family 39 protein [bacterium]